MDDLARDLVETVNYLDESTKKVEQGELIDMTKFELNVQLLCNKIGAMDKEAAKAQGFEKGLEILASKLETLEETMKRKRDEIRDALTDLNKQSKATNAYTKKNNE